MVVETYTARLDENPRATRVSSRETGTEQTWDLPDRPPDDVPAVRARCYPHHIWERSQVNPTMWFNAANGQMHTWRTLVAEHAPLDRHDFEPAALVQVWVVRREAAVTAIEIYATEQAAYLAAGDGMRVQPWAVRTSPEA